MDGRYDEMKDDKSLIEASETLDEMATKEAEFRLKYFGVKKKHDKKKFDKNMKIILKEMTKWVKKN